MAASDVRSTGAWLGAAATVLLAHASLVAALWDSGTGGLLAQNPPRVIDVALLSAPIAPIAPAAPAVRAAPRLAAVTSTAQAPQAAPAAQTPLDATAEADAQTAPTQVTDVPVESPQAPPSNGDRWAVAQATAQAPSPSTDAATPPAPVLPPQAGPPPETPPATPPATPPVAPVWQPPVSGAWAYDVAGRVKGLNYQANATMSWQQNGPGYDARLELRVLFLGSRVQHSQGRMAPDGLVPERFTDKARHERQLVFDWPQGQVVSPGRTAPLLAGAQDRLSVFLQLGWLLARQTQPPAAGQTWTLPVASASGTEPWTFAFAGAQRLQLPAGQLDTWKLSHQRRTPDGQQIELWFAPALHHLPVRIRIVQDNGDEVDQQLNTPIGR